jgi:hypothetical protein
MSDIIDGFRAMKEERQADGVRRREHNINLFEAAKNMAQLHGLHLRQLSAVHYQLRKFGGVGWLINLYPGNQRIYADGRRKAPYLRIAKDELTR